MHPQAVSLSTEIIIVDKCVLKRFLKACSNIARRASAFEVRPELKTLCYQCKSQSMKAPKQTHIAG
jgi:hypothetical protein